MLRAKGSPGRLDDFREIAKALPFPSVFALRKELFFSEHLRPTISQ
jgi:hypothetical protein